MRVRAARSGCSIIVDLLLGVHSALFRSKTYLINGNLSEDLAAMLLLESEEVGLLFGDLGL